MFSENRPISGDSRPSSITRSIRGSFSSQLEILPPEEVANEQSTYLASNSSHCYETVESCVEELHFSEVEEDVNQNQCEKGNIKTIFIKDLLMLDKILAINMLKLLLGRATHYIHTFFICYITTYINDELTLPCTHIHRLPYIN